MLEELGCLNVCIKECMKARQGQQQSKNKLVEHTLKKENHCFGKSVFKLPNSKHEHQRENSEVSETPPLLVAMFCSK